MPPENAAIELKSDVNELTRLSQVVDDFCDAIAIPDADRFALQVALEEVAMNIITHGFKRQADRSFTVTMSASDDAVTIVTRDHAPAYDPLARPEVDTSLALEDRPIGGLGVHLVKKVMQEARYERRDGQNILTLIRQITRTP